MLMRNIEAANMQEAMQIARDTLGEDAVILSSRKDGDGGVIVTFATDREEIPVPQQPILPIANDNRPDPAAMPSFLQSGILEDCLRYHNVPSAITEDALAMADALHLADCETLPLLEDGLSQLFRQMFRFEPLRLDSPSQRLMFVGMPGAGKSLSIARMATQQVMAGLPVHLITTDCHRAGATEQLQSLARVLGVPLDIADSRATLDARLRDLPADMPVLIDSSGCNPYDLQDIRALGDVAHVQDVQAVLVFPAGLDSAEASEMASVFSFLDIERIIVTRTDCARHFGSLLAAAKAGDYAFSHLAASPRPAMMLQPMQAQRLAALFTLYQRERIAA